VISRLARDHTVRRFPPHLTLAATVTTRVTVTTRRLAALRPHRPADVLTQAVAVEGENAISFGAAGRRRWAVTVSEAVEIALNPGLLVAVTGGVLAAIRICPVGYGALRGRRSATRSHKLGDCLPILANSKRNRHDRCDVARGEWW
jgi:hypothetical protein